MVDEILKDDNGALISEWLDIYHSDCDERKKLEVKTLIVIQMMPVVNKITRTIARRQYDPIEDLTQAGSVGLLKAIDCYSKEKNDNFRVFAGYYIIGEIKHYLRDKLNMIRVPSYIQELNIRINGFISTLTPEEVKNLTSNDLATVLHVSQERVNYARDVERRCRTISLDSIYRMGDDDSLGYEELFESNGFTTSKDYTDEKILLNAAMKKLPEEAKTLLEMFYKKDMSQRDIAKKMGLTEMQVSRRLKKIFELINSYIEETKNLKKEIQSEEA